MTPRRHCTGAILAGGRATRFDGIPKGLERVGAMRMIDRVARALTDACDDVLLVANDGAAGTWLPGVPIVPDVRAGAGALGGLHAALVHARHDVMVLPWDAPFVSGALLRNLRDAGELDDADAAVPSSASPWGFEPLCAWYAPRCLAVVEEHLDRGDYRAGGWQHEVRALHVDVSSWGDPAVLFYSVNTAAELAHAGQLHATLQRSS